MTFYCATFPFLQHGVIINQIENHHVLGFCFGDLILDFYIFLLNRVIYQKMLKFKVTDLAKITQIVFLQTGP